MNYIVVLVVIIYFFRLSWLWFSDMPIYSIIAMSIVFLGIFFAVILVAFHYIKLVINVSTMKQIWPYFLLLGIWILSVSTFYNFAQILNDRVLLLSFIIFVICFPFVGNRFMELIVDRFPIGKDIKMLASRYPPIKRSDLLRGDMVILTLSLMPFIAKMIHS